MRTLIECIQSAAGTGPAYGSVTIATSDTVATFQLNFTDMKEFAAALEMKANADAFRKQRDDLREQVARLTNTNAELSAAVAQKTEGTPVAWKTVGQYGYCYRDTEEEARRTYAGAKVYPLFAAVQPSAQAGELAAKVEALGKELAIAQDNYDHSSRERDGFRSQVAAYRAGTKTARSALVEGERLERVIEELRAAVAQMADGEPATWVIDYGNKIHGTTYGSDAAAAFHLPHLPSHCRSIPLFRAVQLSTDSAELAAKVEALGKELTDARADLDDAAELRNAAEDRARTLRESLDAERRMREDAEARVKARDGAKPVMWAVFQGDFVRTGFHDKSRTETVARDWSNSTVEPLYRHPPKPASEAPPPAAIGVEGERFVVLEIDRLRTVNTKGPDHLIGTRAQAEERAKALHGAAYRLVPIDAKTVDVATIRLRARELDASDLPHVAASLLAAIGEKGG